ncbi:MAG: CRISPR-associated endonuclease Cas3'', partial [Paracoccaceae bacterium]
VFNNLHFVKLVAVLLHDLGKLSESFRAMIDEGTPQGQRHWQITELYLRQLDQELGHQLGADLDIRFVLYAATAGHHGGPPNLSARDAKRTLHRLPKGRTAMREAAMALAALWPDATLDGLTYADALDLSWWLPGLVSAADWIGSNTTWFPAVPPGPDLPHYLELARGKARIAVRATGYGQARPQDGALFDFDLRPMQSACQSIPLPDGPMLAVIEDETGAGKTEAAFLLAQRMMMAGKGQGLFFALPTMATSDAMFLRARDTVGRLFETPPSVTLSHGRAGLSVPFQQLWSASAMRTEDVTCTEWLADDRRRALLADVGVGTIDQALLAALPTRFNTLRHFGLSSKILIVDEVH